MKRVENLRDNDLSGSPLNELKELFKLNKCLEYLNLGDCKLNELIGETIGDTLALNKTLKALLLYGNSIEDMKKGQYQYGQALIKNKSLTENKSVLVIYSGDKGCEGMTTKAIIQNKF